MALYHFHVTQIKRSAGQSAIASAAYRAGEKLYSEYYGETSDYSHKKGVISSEILLPPNAPPEYADRQTLWNALERAERSKDAQLAYSFDIALQNEFSLEENIALARQFVSEQLVSRGMIADLAVHMPDKEIQNPHFHILCPIRPLKENGKWGYKQHRVYHLDEQGNRILDENGKATFDAVSTTDWGSPERLESWRAAWAALCNAKFAEKGLNCRIDHRSYERQGIDLIPTVHEGPAVRQMEAKGIPTDKGNLNRWIRSTNAAIRNLRKKIATLDWLKEVKRELSQPQQPNLGQLLGDYIAIRNAGAWSRKAKLGNLQQFVEAHNYIMENRLFTVEALEERVESLSDQVAALKAELDASNKRRKELKDLLQQAESYARLKPIFDEMNGIRWKGQREKYRQEHESELRQFYMTQRKLKDAFTPDGKLPISAWRQEMETLAREHEAAYARYKPLRDDLTKLLQVRHHVNVAWNSAGNPSFLSKSKLKKENAEWLKVSR